jgi:hypothetical protein
MIIFRSYFFILTKYPIKMKGFIYRAFGKLPG